MSICPDTFEQNMKMMSRLLSTGYNDDMYYKIMDFWDDPELVQWFSSHGYTLYHRVWDDGTPCSYTVPALPFDEVADAKYPYAHYNACQISGQDTPLRAYDSTGKVVFAQDSEQRHVAIKLVAKDTDEYRILCFLHEQPYDTLRENCIIPVLDLLPFKDFWVAVMPRWGTNVVGPRNHTLREMLLIMQSMLKGLAFLHSNNIIHRDIKIGNMLINHFSDDQASLDFLWEEGRRFYPSPRADLRKQGKLLYALMDFDISIMVPREIRKEEYRRPYRDSFAGSGYHPHDTTQGEFDYNPFAFDVGTLGVVFCGEFQHYSRHIPMLAPLLDKMIIRDVENRFTAAEALQFFEEMRPGLTDEQLDMEESCNPEGCVRYDEYDRWRDLSEDFKLKWAAYRQPPTPFTTRVLRAIYSSRYMPYYLIPNFRWFFSKLPSAPRFIWARFLAFVGVR